MAREVELWRHRKVTIGTTGAIQLSGDGILPRHAQITAEQDGLETSAAMLRPLEGPVSVERYGRRALIVTDWQLADGDVIIVGGRRLKYRNLGSPSGATRRASGEKEVARWML